MTQEHIPGPLDGSEKFNAIFEEYYSHESANCFKIRLPFTRYASETLVLCPVFEGKEKAIRLAREAVLKRVNEALPMPPDPEHIPSKPGVEAPGDATPSNAMIRLRMLKQHLCGGHCHGAPKFHVDSCVELSNDIAIIDCALNGVGTPAAPLDAQDVEMVDRIVGATAIFSTGMHLNNAPRMEFDAARATLLSRLASLRESVASLTRERDAARKALELAHKHLQYDCERPMDHEAAFHAVNDAIKAYAQPEAQNG